MPNLSKNKLNFLRSLHQKKVRSAEKVFLVEGVKMVQEVIDNHSDLLNEIYTTDLQAIDSKSILPIEISEKELERISAHKSPNVCAAVVRFPEVEPKGKFTIVLDEVQNPGNLGTIIRLADWYGIDDIVCSVNTADCYNSKVIQACMGSIFRCSVRYVNLSNYLNNDDRSKYAAVMNGTNLYTIEQPESGILVMGNEGNGISPAIQSICDQAITIPRIGNAESLNVSVATGICLAAFFGK